MEDLFIDIGLDSAEQAGQVVQVGDLVTIKRCFDLRARSWLAKPSTIGRV